MEPGLQLCKDDLRTHGSLLSRNVIIRAFWFYDDSITSYFFRERDHETDELFGLRGGNDALDDLIVRELGEDVIGPDAFRQLRVVAR